jgi:hypothetical protein
MLKNPPDVPDKEETSVTIEMFYHGIQKGSTNGDEIRYTPVKLTRIPHSKKYNDRYVVPFPGAEQREKVRLTF